MDKLCRLTLIFALIVTLAPSAFAEIAKPLHFVQQGPHQVQTLNSGMGALEKRLTMIENARKSIEAEYFIWKKDRAGRLFLQALLKKAQQGVRVRLLIDATPIGRHIGRFEAEAMRRFSGSDLQVRFYNSSWLANHRNHRKLLVVDGTQAIMGGRNIGEEYFDLSDEYNFLDRDLWIKGPIVGDILATFNAYWESPLATEDRPNTAESTRSWMEPLNQLFDPDDPDYAKNFLTPSAADNRLRKEVRTIGQKALGEEFQGQCQQMRVVSNLPGFRHYEKWKNDLLELGEALTTHGARIHQTAHTELLRVFESFMNGAHESVIAENPYFVPKSYGEELLKGRLNKNVKVSVLTNSPFSTDNAAIAAINKTRIPLFAKMGLDVALYSGRSPQQFPYLKEGVKQTRWGTHAKTFIFDRRHTAIGTFNLDPRSRDVNAEVMVFCEDQADLAEAIEQSIDRRRAQSVLLDKEGMPQQGQYQDFLFNLSQDQKRIIQLLELPAGFFDFLL